MTGIVQFTNYLRPMQFITLVSVLNERLKLLDDKIVKINIQSESHDGRFTFDHLTTSTRVFDKIEVYRETFTKIWKMHELLNCCFGMSILVIMMNACLSAAFTLYFTILDSSKMVTSEFITQPAIHTFHIAFLFVVLVHTCDTSNDIVSEMEKARRRHKCDFTRVFEIDSRVTKFDSERSWQFFCRLKASIDI